MKKVLGIIVITLLVILIIIVSANMKKDMTLSLAQNEDIKKSENIEFYISYADSKSVKYVIENNTKEDIIYGAEYKLQKYIDGQWNQYNVMIDFIEIAYIVKPNEKYEDEIVLATIFGELDKGKYRIIKKINDYKMSAEFEIN